MSDKMVEHYREQFDTLRNEVASTPWLRQSRVQALDRFAELGLPTLRNEDWKYTNVAVLGKRYFNPALEASADDGLAGRVRELMLEGCHVMTFVDGHYSAELSDVGELPEGARVAPLSRALYDWPERVETLLANFEQDEEHGLAALNTAMWTDGAMVDIPANVEIDRPLQLLFVSTRSELATFPRNLVHAGENARVKLIEHYWGPEDCVYMTDAVTHIGVAAGARVGHTKVQQESGKAFHVADIRAEQAEGAGFDSASFAFGSQLSRTAIASRMQGRFCETTMDGLYAGRKRQHQAHHTRTDHQYPDCTSSEYYKGVLEDHARAVFDGRIIVQRDAQHTDAQMANHNLLLSDNAEVDTKPQLEIYADDVKCAHGATVGQLDPEHLHYLRTRGLGQEEARTLLIHAFAAEILERVEHPSLRRHLMKLMPGALPEAFVEVD